MLNLNDTEEILAILIAVAIVLGFVYSTYKEIQSTIAEEKGKLREKRKPRPRLKRLSNTLTQKKS